MDWKKKWVGWESKDLGWTGRVFGDIRCIKRVNEDSWYVDLVD